MTKRHSYTTRIHKGDLEIFPGLAFVLLSFPTMYKVVENTKSWITVKWLGSSLGADEATKLKNDELLDPYKQAEHYTKYGTIVIC